MSPFYSSINKCYNISLDNMTERTGWEEVYLKPVFKHFEIVGYVI